MPISIKKLLKKAILAFSFADRRFVRLALVLVAALAAFTISFTKVSAQSPFFSQFDAIPMHFNPAFAGNDISPEVTAIFRDQWPGLEHTFLTYGVAFEQYFEDFNSGFGITVLSDRQAGGLLNSYSGGLTYSFGVQLSNYAHIRIGVEASYTQRRIAWEDLRFFDQINLLTGFNDGSGLPNPTGEIAPNDYQSQYFDAGIGALIFNRKLFAGLSMGHLTQPNAAFFNGAEDILPYRLGFQAGGKFPLSLRHPEQFFEPLVLFIAEGPSLMAYGEIGLEMGPIKPLVGFRHTISNTSAVVGGFRIKAGVFRMGYSYDFALGNLAGPSGGAHELSISVLLQTDHQRKLDRELREAISCPLF